MAGRNLRDIVEAVLFASEEALGADRIAGALERQDATPRAVRDCVADLNEAYDTDGRAFEIVEVAGGYKMVTRPEFNSYIRRVQKSRSRDRLSQAALETLAVVAYRQPATRAEIENVRGVESGPMLRMLVDRGLVRVAGRAEQLGHPLLYGTTKLFLEQFGLKDLDSLPQADELMRKDEGDEQAEAEQQESAEAEDQPAEAADESETPTHGSEETAPTSEAELQEPGENKDPEDATDAEPQSPDETPVDDDTEEPR